MENEKIIKCDIKLDWIFYPKGLFKVKSGEFSIFSADIIKPIENCEELTSNNKKSKIKLKGLVCALEKNVTYRVSCRLSESHMAYGDTYEIIFISKYIDLSSKDKQKKFLEGIINPNIVDKLFEEYNDIISLLENKDVLSLTKVNGIGNTTAMRLIQEYEDSKDYSEVYAELSHLNLTSNMIKKLIGFYKSPSLIVERINENPYSLVEVDGIGFKKADEIARMMGIGVMDKRRINACILHNLNESGEKGRSYLLFSELMETVNNQIGFVELGIVKEVVKELMSSEKIRIEGQQIGLLKYYNLENDIKEELLRVKNAENKFEIDPNWEYIVLEAEQKQGFNFTDEQFNTIKLILKENVLVVTGNAGVGKTATINGAVKVLKDYMINAAALSGKASVRITEATGLQSSTIHKLLGYMNGQFEYNENNPLKTDVVIVDEATMINGNIYLSLLKAIPDGAKLLMLGDHRQLTPIGNCQVFNDILESNLIPTMQLTKIHRQAEASGIIPTSIKITNQEQIFDSRYEGNSILGELQDMELDIYKNDDSPADRVIRHFIKQYERTNDIMETQVLSPMRTRGDLSTYNLNTNIQSIINPVSKDDVFIEIKLDKEKLYKIKLGDKVINTKNNYKCLDEEGNVTPVFNGNMGIITEIDHSSCVVDFIGIGKIVLDREAVKNLELGYAITIHKSQGSGFHTVIVAIESAAYVLLNAELLYTGITRAKKYCVLVGQNHAIRTSIGKREVKHKQTYLKYMLTA
ncbi:AAA family ATPase [Niallia alba]|uniref:AAA family ATPase n=1 Tax=Niallia alba TaxID=2729105 RepID=UPI002E236DA2|nr:AAA family ATPase [Niallia alba]